MASVGIASIAAVVYFGFAYDRYISIVPNNWYEPMSLAVFVQKAIVFQNMLGFLPIIFAAFVFLPPVLFLFHGKIISSRHAILLLPLVTSFSMKLWGTYWFLREFEGHSMRLAESWQMQILNFFLQQTCVCIGLVLLVTIFSSCWRGERKWVVYILLIELLYSFFTFFVAGMGTANIWP